MLDAPALPAIRESRQHVVKEARAELRGGAVERAPRRWGRGSADLPEIERPTRHLDVFRMLVPDQLPFLYFVFSRRQAEAYARQLAVRLNETLLDRD